MRWRRSRIMCCKCTKAFLCSSHVASPEFPLSIVRKAFKREFSCYWSKEKKKRWCAATLCLKAALNNERIFRLRVTSWVIVVYASVFSCRTHSAIVALEQRQRYQRDFSAEYDEYKDLHSRIATITHMFVQLESKIKSLSRGTPEYKVLTVCTSLCVQISVFPNNSYICALYFTDNGGPNIRKVQQVSRGEWGEGGGITFIQQIKSQA